MGAMTRRGGRQIFRFLWCLILALPAFGFGGLTHSAAEVRCAGSARLFAVDAGTGHLAEIRSCLVDRTWVLGPAVEVDRADWRSYSTVFAVADGDAMILYAVTTTGALWWRRQGAPGAATGVPTRIAEGIDWRHDVVFAASSGYLALGDYGTPVRTFRHEGWTTGGTAVAEVGMLFTTFHGPVITSLAPGYAVGTWAGMNYRVWRSPGTLHDDAWYPGGQLPPGVSGVTGNGTLLYGVHSDGDVVLLTQPQVAYSCRLVNGLSWQVSARAAGHFGRVVVPVGAADTPPSVAPPPTDPRLNLNCIGPSLAPWEWQ